MKCLTQAKQQESLEALKQNVKRLLHEETGYSGDALEKHLTISDQCLLWVGTRRKGYGYVEVKRRKLSLHRLIWGLYYRESLISGLVIMHSCDRPECVNPLHLSQGTVKDNTLDAFAKRRRRQDGVFNTRAKLNDNLVREIRLKHTEGVLNSVLAKQFKVSPRAIRDVINRKRWAHVL